MSDTITVQDIQPKVEGQEQQKEEITEAHRKLINDEVKEHTSELKKFYEEKLELQKKELSGVNRANTELDKKLKEYERKELTEKEKIELEKKEIQDEKRSLWIDKAIARNQFITDEKDNINFTDYLFGDTEEVILNKAENLKKYLVNQIAIGVEKGVKEQLASGFKPGSAINQNKQSLQDLSRDELAVKALEISKMPTGPEKTKLLNELNQAQFNRK